MLYGSSTLRIRLRWPDAATCVHKYTPADVDYIPGTRLATSKDIYMRRNKVCVENGNPGTLPTFPTHAILLLCLAVVLSFVGLLIATVMLCWPDSARHNIQVHHRQLARIHSMRRNRNADRPHPRGAKAAP